MLTIQTLERIKNGARITFFNGIFAILYGVLYLIFMNVMLRMNFKTIDVTWKIFSKYNPDFASAFIRLIILKCAFIIAVGIMMIYLSNYILKRKDGVAWVVLFIIGIIFWPVLLTVEILDKNFYGIAAATIGWLTFIIGMVIPIRYYLQKEYTEY